MRMSSDTDMGGRQDEFPGTRRTVLRATACADPDVRREAFQDLIGVYWKPVYKYIRCHWSAGNEEAKDLTQGFFAQALDKGFLERYDPARSRFRTFLRTCIDGFVANERKAAGRIKRGGAVQHLSIDFEAAEEELAAQGMPAGIDGDDYFHQEWVRSLFSLAIDDLQRDCALTGRQVHFQLFEQYDLDDGAMRDRPTYADLAQQFQLTSSQVTNYLALARRLFRQNVLERLRTMTASDEEFRAEYMRLFGGRTA
jgi:DNA-directed RNA polymerase specialized sigma24 family protein